MLYLACYYLLLPILRTLFGDGRTDVIHAMDGINAIDFVDFIDNIDFIGFIDFINNVDFIDFLISSILSMLWLACYLLLLPILRTPFGDGRTDAIHAIDGIKVIDFVDIIDNIHFIGFIDFINIVDFIDFLISSILSMLWLACYHLLLPLLRLSFGD